VLDVGLATGWRISDVLSLRVDDLERGGKVTMTAKKTGKVSAAVLSRTLTSRLRAVAGQWWLFPSPKDDTWPVSRQAAYKAFRKAAKAVGLSMVAPHSMRKSYAIRLYREGMKPKEIQKHMQHDKLETTLLYLLDIL
jgi:integrase